MRASLIQHGEPRRFVMSAPIPLRRDFGASHLRGLARKTKDGPQARRLLALAAIYDGATRTEAAKIGGHRHDTGVDDLPATRHVALGCKMLVEAIKQLFDQPGPGQLLAE